MLAYVGLDANKDVNWVTYPSAESKRLLAEGKIDAFLGFPPDPQELRAKQIGHVVVDGGADRPWSQYFCCLVGANQDFVQKHPQATKRAVRALLKAANLCALEPEHAAQRIADRGYNYAYALQGLQDIPTASGGNMRRRTRSASRPAPTRGRDDQVDPAADYSPGDRLALPHRAEEGVEGVMRRCWRSRGQTSDSRTPSSVRCARASRRPRSLTGHIDSPHSGLHMNNGVRSPWPAFTSGTREGRKPRDNSLATLSRTKIIRPDLIPMLTQGTCVDRP